MGNLSEIIGIVLTVVGLLIGVSGWFIVRVFNDISDRLKEANEESKNIRKELSHLGNITSGLHATQIAYEGSIDELKRTFRDKHSKVCEKLELHDQLLGEHETRISIIEDHNGIKKTRKL